MSERSEAIRSRLAREWKSTRQITDEVIAMGYECSISKTFAVLDSERKYGLAERVTVAAGRSGKTSLWRIPEDLP